MSWHKSKVNELQWLLLPLEPKDLRRKSVSCMNGPEKGRKEEASLHCFGRIERCTCVTSAHVEAYWGLCLLKLKSAVIGFLFQVIFFSFDPNTYLGSDSQPACTRLVLLSSVKLHCLHKVVTWLSDCCGRLIQNKQNSKERCANTFWCCFSD